MAEQEYKVKYLKLLPAFYFLPESMAFQCGEFYRIPRNFRAAIIDNHWRGLLNHDIFLKAMQNALAFMAWPHIGQGNKEVYSGYYPMYMLADCTHYWLDELALIGYSVEELYNLPIGYKIPFLAEETAQSLMKYMVERVSMREHFSAIQEIVDECPCFEDFDFRRSNKKIDFFRKWYHTRTRFETVSLEEYYSGNDEDEHGEINVADEGVSVEEDIVAKIYVEQFKSTLAENDMKILEMRMQGFTYEKISAEMGYQNHSGVLKRIKRIAQQYENFCDKKNINS
ncbi:MAG: hypothetical protein LBM65_03150 [Oscillospiraceae bacterium]|jgi:hypothetical protein|nr:hypothetical protein [Oscillospiraceae bacterium]